MLECFIPLSLNGQGIYSSAPVLVCSFIRTFKRIFRPFETASRPPNLPLGCSRWATYLRLCFGIQPPVSSRLAEMVQSISALPQHLPGYIPWLLRLRFERSLAEGLSWF